MPITTKIKLLLYKVLPKYIFEKILSFYRIIFKNRGMQQYKLKYQIRNFKNDFITNIKHIDKTFKIKIYANNSLSQYNEIYVDGNHEPEIANLMIKYIKSNDIVLDIGANIGYHSMLMSKCVGENGKVIAFEPVPEMQEKFIENLKLNSFNNIHLEKIALSDTIGNIKFYADFINDTGGSSAIKIRDDMKEIEVGVKTLDSLNITKVNFIKIDVEGYEWNVINGAKNIIERNKPIIVLEYSPVFYEKYDKSHSHKILEYLITDYILYDIDDKNKKINNILEYQEKFKENLLGRTNILCLPK